MDENSCAQTFLEGVCGYVTEDDRLARPGRSNEQGALLSCTESIADGFNSNGLVRT